MELIPNWKNAWKFSSVLLLAFLSLFDITVAMLPQVKALLTDTQFASVNAVFAWLAIFSRIVRQYIPVTAEVKQEMIEHVHDLQEVKPEPTETGTKS